MNLPFIIADYLKGKTIYPTVRRLLSLLFTVSITSFLFEKIYFKYSLPNITDYKLIMDFFLKGYFIVPFAIFLVVYGITYFIPLSFWIIYHHKKSVILAQKILEYEIEKNDIERDLSYVRVFSKQISPVVLNKVTLIDIYLQYKDELNPEVLDNISQGCEAEKAALELNFIFGFRCVVVITVYFFVIPYFGWILYLISIVSILMYMGLTLIGYHFFDIFPMVLRKFKFEADKYVNQYLAKRNEVL